MDYKNKKLISFLTISAIGLLLINLTFIGAYIVLAKYGSVTLSPGEKYTVNIPFIGPSKSPIICGKAEQTDGTAIANVKVIANFSSNNSIAGQATTGTDGKYCITLPEITSDKKFDIYLEYDNSTLTQVSNDYDLDFDNDKVYSKSSDEYVYLTGNITNEYARIENGRFEVELGICINNCGYHSGSYDYNRFGGYHTFNVSIDPNEIYEFPNEELNISWNISTLDIGQYKILIKTSFNAREKTGQSVYFNITE